MKHTRNGVELEVHEKELLLLAYWYQGNRNLAPDWVKQHPLWPPNNDKFDTNTSRGKFATPMPGRDRLWEAINHAFGLGL